MIVHNNSYQKSSKSSIIKIISMEKALKNIAEIVTDFKVLVGAVVTIIGLFVWIAISWNDLTQRVSAVEEVQTNRTEQLEMVNDKLEELSKQNAVILERVGGINEGLVETKSLIRQLYNKLIN